MQPPGVPGAHHLIFHHNVSSLISSHFFLPHCSQEKFRGEEKNSGKAGKAFSLTLALSRASIFRQIKLPKLDCAPVRQGETSHGTWRGTTGFCRSCECGNRPCWAGHYMSCCASWVGPTTLCCIYGSCSMMRPIDPFLTVSHKTIQESHHRAGELLSCELLKRPYSGES